MILDNYDIRFNTANQTLEMNIGGENWVPVPSSGGVSTPAGGDREIQFNDAGVFGASSTFKFNADGSTTGPVLSTSAPFAGQVNLHDPGGAGSYNITSADELTLIGSFGASTGEGATISGDPTQALFWGFTLEGLMNLPPLTTTERDAATVLLQAGSVIYNSTTNKLNFYNGTAWEAVTSA